MNPMNKLPVDPYWNNLTEILDLHASQIPNKVAYHFVGRNNLIEESLTYQELRNLSCLLSETLSKKFASGQSAILMFPQSLEFVAAYFSCLRSGVIAVPVSIPNKNRGIEPLHAVVQDSHAKVILTTASTKQRLFELFPSSPLFENIDWIEISIEELRQDISNDNFSLDSEAVLRSSNTDLAMLQYTSGSTGLPKGVKVSHRNLLSNFAMIQQGYGADGNEIIGSWLPMYHDMGLIGIVLQNVYMGSSCYIMSPTQFIKSPISWLRMIAEFSITASGCPNFGYDTCAKRISDEEIKQLDLGRWRIAFCGAEPIRAHTLASFADRFAASGFRSNAFATCYGMAETTLYVTSKSPKTPLKVLTVEMQALEKNRISAIETESTLKEKHSGEHINLVSSGVWPGNVDVKIVDPNTLRQLEEDEVGEIWVSGPAVTQGYWEKDRQTNETYNFALQDENDNRYLRTNDLGFLHDGELFVTGRFKEMMIINGKNIYPSDIEASIDREFNQYSIAGVTAFHVTKRDYERAVIIAETTLPQMQKEKRIMLSKSIQEHVVRKFGVPVEDVVLIRRNALPKTTSGKLQRLKLKSLYLEGSIQTSGLQTF